MLFTKAVDFFKNNWKKLLYFCSILSLILFFNLYPPAKQAIVSLGEHFQNQGILGDFMIILLLGGLIIPLSLPYMLLEATIALIIPSFWKPFALAICSKVLGCSVCFVLIRYCFKDYASNICSQYKLYRGIERLLQRNPLKFSLVLRFIFLPYVVKNYGLALPDCINYYVYITAAFITGIVQSTIHILIVQQTKNAVSGTEESSSLLSIALFVFGICSIGYVVYYTRKTMKEMEADELNEMATDHVELVEIKEKN